MRAFISYKYTGVDPSTFQDVLLPLIAKFREMGDQVFCNIERDEFYRVEKWSAKQIMAECLNELEKCDYHVTFVSGACSTGEGMMIERGYALKMNIPTVLLAPVGCKAVSSVAVIDKLISYSGTSDLLEKIGSFKTSDM